MTSKVKNEIFKQLIVQIAFFKILFLFHFSHAKLNSTNSNNYMINFDDNFLIRFRDVYNLKTELRKNEFDFLSSMQTLMNQFNIND
jgi:hypothetical protein